MKKISFTVEFVSDAELSSGFGSNLVDGLVARDLDGNPMIPASHIKGLMLQAVKNIPDAVIPKERKRAVLKFFGKPGAEFENSASFSVCCGKISKESIKDSETRLIARTSLNEFGTAKKGSLRISEAICAGTKFKGRVYLNNDSPLLDVSVRYALLSIFEMGGSRSRGAGACFVEIEKENRTPGELFQSLLEVEENFDEEVSVEAKGDSEKTVVVKISFEAENPVCVPETPVVGNAIVSGFTIPASAVQGCLLTRIDRLNSDVATACFKSEKFRAWPLEPLPTGDEFKGAFAVRASASHKISKLADEKGKYNFCDETIENYEWDKIKENLPIKSADGVMIRLKDKRETVLWRSGDMARHLTAHGVVNGGERGDDRNLYTVESLAERFFVGFATLPETAYNLLVESLRENSTAFFGKSRSVRGQGTLKVEKLEHLPFELPRDKSGAEIPAFIVQSPLLIDDDISEASANEMLKKLVKRYWNLDVKECSANVQIRFGWNRHQKGLQNAARVIAPGSVFRLKEKPDDVEELLEKGLGDGRERGLGAVLPHPNIAVERFDEIPKPDSLPKSDGAAKHGYELWEKACVKGKSSLSASQISTILDLISKDSSPKSALDFLKKQIEKRPDKIWNRWKPVFSDVESMIDSKSIEYSVKALKVWHNLVVAEEERNKQ